MSFIQVNLDETIKERSAVPAGAFDLVISDVSDKPANSGSAMLTITHAIDGDDDAMPVKHWITLPTKGDDADTVRQKSLGLKRYLEVAGIDYGEEGFDTDVLYGHAFSCSVTNELVDTDKDGNPIDSPYEVNRLSIPFLASE
ncbi:MAG: hypothetical protein COA94_04875 [Rickettsiales bacterium]|nr:MAG: hypothetical protein COA94_04875 [Rickettsiales bacterium]